MLKLELIVCAGIPRFSDLRFGKLVLQGLLSVHYESESQTRYEADLITEKDSDCRNKGVLPKTMDQVQPQAAASRDNRSPPTASPKASSM